MLTIFGLLLFALELHYERDGWFHRVLLSFDRRGRTVRCDTLCINLHYDSLYNFCIVWQVCLQTEGNGVAWECSGWSVVSFLFTRQRVLSRLFVLFVRHGAWRLERHHGVLWVVAHFHWDGRPVRNFFCNNMFSLYVMPTFKFGLQDRMKRHVWRLDSFKVTWLGLLMPQLDLGPARDLRVWHF